MENIEVRLITWSLLIDVPEQLVSTTSSQLPLTTVLQTPPSIGLLAFRRAMQFANESNYGEKQASPLLHAKFQSVPLLSR